MCVAALAWQTHPDRLLVVIANRDEYHERPTAPLARWPDDRRTIIAGKDLQAGGTWLGVNGGGRLALVTNYRVESYPRPDLASRGSLVSGWLRDQPPTDGATMNPYNLVLVEPGVARLATNYPEAKVCDLASGVHGVSNGPLASPWAKTERLCAALVDWLTAGAPSIEPLFIALRDETPLAGPGPEPHLSPVFIRDPVYGTRCSTVVIVGADGAGRIVERRFDPSGGKTGETALDFVWPPFVSSAP